MQTPAIRDAYNTAVTALKKFRDHHIRVACLYIVSMSKTSPIKGCPMSAMIEKARREQEEMLKRGPIRGTGGNELTTLLKAGRDATKRALIQ
jgi:indoleamine 2,3-dioxygenase